jgi:hypothetical protein
MPGEFVGLGARETPDETGKPVTMEVVAVREGKDLRAWLGLGVIKCRGPFKDSGPIVGECTEIAGDPAGPFRAERVEGR